MRTVLVTRPRPAADELAEKLKREGFEVYLAPLSEYVGEACDIGPLAVYQALVFTSAEAVRIFTEKSQERMHTVFAVGETTAKVAAKAGFMKVWQAAGSSDDIVSIIRKKKDDLGLKRILHISGAETSQDLAAELINDGISVEKKIVYSTKYVEQMPAWITRALIAGDISTVTLFSPKAAAHFVQMLQKRDLRDASVKLEAVCLSPRVAEELTSLPWKKVSIASRPHVDAVIDTLKEEEKTAEGAGACLSAAPVIDAFGGLRPLASRLGIPASTVQGWKERGVIPERRTEEILKAAAEDHINLADVPKLKASPEDAAAEKAAHDEAAAAQLARERRTGADRRQKFVVPDKKGNVQADTYVGSDRRTGLDRRAFMERQKQVIRREKAAILLKSLLGVAVIGIPLVAAGVFVFMPEYLDMRANAARVAEVEAQIRRMNDSLFEMKKSGEKQNVLGSEIAGRLEKLQAAALAQPASPPQDVPAAPMTAESKDSQSIEDYLRLLSRVNVMKATPEGSRDFTSAMERLKDALPRDMKQMSDANDMIDALRLRDAVLGPLFEGVEKDNLGAASLLLGLTEFRARVGRREPFENDLALLKKFGAENKDVGQSLEKIAPYAETGVPSYGELQQEFKGLAMDIVMAKLQGEDISVQEKVLKRMGGFVKMRKTDEIEGNTVDAIVARADLAIGKGDIAGALKELYTLQGMPKEVAASWIAEAEGHLAAEGIAGAIVKSFSTGISAGINPQVDGILPLISGSLSGGPVPLISPSGQGQGPGGNPIVLPAFGGK